jgi:hypothetical protein
VSAVDPQLGRIVSAIYPVRDKVRSELESMSHFARNVEVDAALKRLGDTAESLLQSIDREIREGVIRPWSFLRLSANAPFPPLVGSPLNVGVYPLAADPLEWGHILAALATLAVAKLDRIVFIVIDGGGGEPQRLPLETRRTVARDVLGRFSPLLLYSPMRTEPGEGCIEAFFRFLSINERQPMGMHLLCGSPTGGDAAVPCTEVTRGMEEAMLHGLHGYDSWTHPISLVHIGEMKKDDLPPSSFPRAFVTVPRFAVRPGNAQAILASIPYSGFRHISRFWVKAETVGN